MQGLALLMTSEGFRVTGSDRDTDHATRTLAGHGVSLFPEDDLQPVRDAVAVIYSSAIPADHPALAAAREAGIATLKRARAMGALVNGSRLAAVAGTHGKTTVTAMLALAAEAGGFEPAALVGGRVPGWDGNALLGSGDLAIVEADEFDRSFLELDPALAIVTSVEPEHLESYGSYADLRSAFADFAARAAARDGVLVCADDDGAAEIGAIAGARASYGFTPGADYLVEVVSHDRSAQRCRLLSPAGHFEFGVGAPGAHNAQNACGAIAAALLLGVDPECLPSALSSFRGVERRLQVLLESDRRIIVDDYAHHPTEVRASISALRETYPERRIAIVFQPHLYSRTRSMAAGFATALGAADDAFVLPIHPARERPIAGVTSRLIVDAGSAHVHGTDPERVLAWLADEPGDLVVGFMGAGDVTELAHRAAREAGSDAVEE
jgi:UDP-N-acetylmuramate--alanine ligase